MAISSQTAAIVLVNLQHLRSTDAEFNGHIFSSLFAIHMTGRQDTGPRYVFLDCLVELMLGDLGVVTVDYLLDNFKIG